MKYKKQGKSSTEESDLQKLLVPEAYSIFFPSDLLMRKNSQCKLYRIQDTHENKLLQGIFC